MGASEIPTLAGKLKTALLFGATGLVGGNLLKQLAEHPGYEKIKVFSRRSIAISHQKIEQHIIDFSKLNDCQSLILGDDLFCCLGTTISGAGSKKAFIAVDYEIPVKIGSIAERNGIKHLLAISSVGADIRSFFLYLKTKGEMEEALRHLNIPRVTLFRPSLLLGKREEFRFGEAFGKIIASPPLSSLFLGPFERYKPVKAETVARAMLNAANKKYMRMIVEACEIEQLGNT